MKSILCFGDSNTWGFDAEAWSRGQPIPRFPPDLRWPGVLAVKLGPGYKVIEEGLNGRTTVFDDPIEGLHKNGSRYLLASLESHAPLDLVVIMLGTNDLKERFSAPASDIAMGAACLARTALASGTGPQGRAPSLLLVAPFPVGEEIRVSPFGEMFGYERSVEKSRLFGERFAAEASALGVAFLDAAAFVVAHPLDSIHLSADAHRTLGEAVAFKIGTLLEV
jgi:lysophospholipase L1-like esterase